MASLVRVLRDLDLAEEVLQEAFVMALQHWPAKGIPDQPRAWLLQVARRKALDRLRRESSFAAKQSQLELLTELNRQTWQEDVDQSIPDERLRLIFTCCHPALAESAQVVLTLRTLGGLSTAEIARAFLVPETTLAQRLVRAKRKIKAAKIPYEVPAEEFWPERLGSALSVIYFIFNEGYVATAGETLTRSDLCQEAIRLGQVMTKLVPQHAEAAGLLALMLLHESRRAARCDAAGNLMTLADQDRSLWNRDQIRAGTSILKEALALGPVGPYQIQAAVSALHAEAKNYSMTDWQEITLLYDRLYQLQPSPVVRLNAIVALSMARGPAVGLAALGELERDGALAQYQPFFAAKADLLRRAGRCQEAAEAFQQALTLTSNTAERRFLEQRLSDLQV